MNYYLIFAAGLAFVAGVVHSWLGERYILIRLFRLTNLPHLLGSDVFTKRTLRFVWHLMTVAGWGFAGLLALYASEQLDQLARAALTIIAVTFLTSSVVALVVSRGRHLSWLAFFAIAIATWYGAR